MKKLLIFHACIPSYRLDFFDKLADTFNSKAILFGRPGLLSSLGFDVKGTAKKSKLYHEWHHGKYIGDHLVSEVYRKSIADFHPDLVYCQELGLNTLAAIFLKPFYKYKIMVGVDDSPAMLCSYGKIRSLLRRFVFKSSDYVLLVNNIVKSKLEVLFPKVNFLYMPIIQSEKTFITNLEVAKQPAEKLIIDYNLERKHVYLFVGRIEEVKQPLMLLKTYGKVNIADSILVFVGTGAQDNELKRLVDDLRLNEQVIITGKQTGTDLYRWYRVADTFVLPSKYEPFGAVVNEALLSGCRVVVSDKVGAATLVNENNGMVVPFDSEIRLADALKSEKRNGKKESLNSLMPFTFDEMYEKFVSEIK